MALKGWVRGLWVTGQQMGFHIRKPLPPPENGEGNRPADSTSFVATPT